MTRPDGNSAFMRCRNLRINARAMQQLTGVGCCILCFFVSGKSLYRGKIGCRRLSERLKQAKTDINPLSRILPVSPERESLSSYSVHSLSEGSAQTCGCINKIKLVFAVKASVYSGRRKSSFLIDCHCFVTVWVTINYLEIYIRF